MVSKESGSEVRAKKAHEDKIAKIMAKYDTSIKKLNKDHDAKLKEYDDEKAQLEVTLGNLQEEYDNKLNSLQVQKSSILTAVSNLKKDMENKQSEYDSSVKQLEQEHIVKLEEMAKKQEEELAKVTVEYEEIPNSELEAVQNDYQIKQKGIIKKYRK